MGNLRYCDRCGKPFVRDAKPYRADVSGGPAPLSVHEQSKRRVHAELCGTCAAETVAFIRGGK